MGKTWRYILLENSVLVIIIVIGREHAGYFLNKKPLAIFSFLNSFLFFPFTSLFLAQTDVRPAVYVFSCERVFFL